MMRYGMSVINFESLWSSMRILYEKHNEIYNERW